LFDVIRRRSPLRRRIAILIARYARIAGTLDDHTRGLLRKTIVEHGSEIVGWLERVELDRAAAALAIHVPGLRAELLSALDHATAIAPCVLLALVELGTYPPSAIDAAVRTLDDREQTPSARMAAAAFLARYGDPTPELTARIDRELPASAAATLASYVGELWTPLVDRVVAAPLEDARVLFSGDKLVLVMVGDKSVVLPRPITAVKRGDVLKVGITPLGKPRLALVTDDAGRVTVFDL
jgi:hypothetical protein